MDIENDNFSVAQHQNSILIEIRVNKAHTIARIILIILILISAITPIIVLFYAINMNREIGVGYIFSLLLFVISLIFFLRMFLWNAYGKEVFLIENNKVLFYNDYKYFKDNLKQFDFNKIIVGCIPQGGEDFNKIKEVSKLHDYCRFSILVNDKELIKSNISIKTKIISKIEGLKASNVSSD